MYARRVPWCTVLVRSTRRGRRSNRVPLGIVMISYCLRRECLACLLVALFMVRVRVRKPRAHRRHCHQSFERDVQVSSRRASGTIGKRGRGIRNLRLWISNSNFLHPYHYFCSRVSAVGSVSYSRTPTAARNGVQEWPSAGLPRAQKIQRFLLLCAMQSKAHRALKSSEFRQVRLQRMVLAKQACYTCSSYLVPFCTHMR